MPKKNEFLTMSALAKLSPSRPSASACWRWARKGMLARNGERVYLRHVRSGRKIYSTSKWLDEFFDALAQADREGLATPQPVAPRPYSTRTPSERDRAIERANADCIAAGA